MRLVVLLRLKRCFVAPPCTKYNFGREESPEALGSGRPSLVRVVTILSEFELLPRPTRHWRAGGGDRDPASHPSLPPGSPPTIRRRPSAEYGY